MNNRNENSFQVKDFFLETKEILKMRAVLKRVGFSKKILFPEGGKNFSAFQVFGEKDISGLEALSSEEKIEYFTNKIRSKSRSSCKIYS